MVPDSLLSVFDEYELEVRDTAIEPLMLHVCNNEVKITAWLIQAKNVSYHFQRLYSFTGNLSLW